MFKREHVVSNPLLSLLLAGSPSDDNNMLCDSDDLSMKTHQEFKIESYVRGFTIMYTFMEITTQFVRKE